MLLSDLQLRVITESEYLKISAKYIDTVAVFWEILVSKDWE